MARAKLFVDMGNDMQYTILHLGHVIIHHSEGEGYRSVSTYTEHLQNILLRQKKKNIARQYGMVLFMISFNPPNCRHLGY